MVTATECMEAEGSALEGVPGSAGGPGRFMVAALRSARTCIGEKGGRGAGGRSDGGGRKGGREGKSEAGGGGVLVDAAGAGDAADPVTDTVSQSVSQSVSRSVNLSVSQADRDATVAPQSVSESLRMLIPMNPNAVQRAPTHGYGMMQQCAALRTHMGMV